MPERSGEVDLPTWAYRVIGPVVGLGLVSVWPWLTDGDTRPGALLGTVTVAATTGCVELWLRLRSSDGGGPSECRWRSALGVAKEVLFLVLAVCAVAGFVSDVLENGFPIDVIRLAITAFWVWLASAAIRRGA